MHSTGPAATIQDLRREVAAAESELVNAEIARYTADRNYAELRGRIERLRAELTAMGG
jgi:hypothetical protein